LGALGSTDHTFSCQALQRGGRANSEQPSNRNATFSYDHFLPLTGSLKPVTQMRSQVAHSYIHAASCTTNQRQNVRIQVRWGAVSDSKDRRRR
jgi:hypothetical protein